MKYRLLILLSGVVFLFSCAPSKQIAKSARKNVLSDEALQAAHVGISIYEPATGKYWYNYQGDKYFVPASNTKLPTCYAAMKYLGDSLVAARVSANAKNELLIFPSADPTFLNPEFPYQPLFEKMKDFDRIYLYSDDWKEERWGNGWAWNDYDASYMAERSMFPLYGNVLHFKMAGDTLKFFPKNVPVRLATSLNYNASTGVMKSSRFKIERNIDDNEFFISSAKAPFSTELIPLRTDLGSLLNFLKDTLRTEVAPAEVAEGFSLNPQKTIIHSQPTDSLLKPMMHRSDNFFAEQSLLMVSNELLGVMNDAKIIDTLLKTDFKDLPQKPRWVDGSGLSRYNLFSPQDFVFILNKMKTDFGMDRIKTILPTGNEGTLEGRFIADSNYLFAKTGTLSGVVSLSGFVYTKKNKLLIFSILVNNHNASATQVRRAVEKFVQGIRDKY
jgi:D-alanyl-D-alanine carboxypeptidase/D-alanyl-D-alanine-endopeptidase (penicillin-binding protein 4)